MTIEAMNKNWMKLFIRITPRELIPSSN